MIVYLIRHTKPDCPTGICYGKTDLDLAVEYESEIEEVHSKLDGIQFDQVYSSPLKRCRILAESFVASSNIVFDDRLKELDFGLWEMKSWVEIEQSKDVKAWYKDYVHIRVPEGESYIDLIERVKSFVHDIDRDHKTIGVFCHSAVIRAFHVVLKNVDPKETFDMKLTFGAVKILEMAV